MYSGSSLPPTPQCTQCSVLSAQGLYNYYDDEKEKVQILEMPLAHKLSSLIILMPHHVEPLERLEKLLTKEQLKVWMGKMQKKAVAISLPKGVVEVTHDLQVRLEGRGLDTLLSLLGSAGVTLENKCGPCPWAEEQHLNTVGHLLYPGRLLNTLYMLILSILKTASLG